MSHVNENQAEPFEAAPAPAAEQPSTWVEPVALAYRLKRSAIAGSISLVLAGWLTYAQWKIGALSQPTSLWIVVILGIGLWRAFYWIRLETVRRYASIRVTFTLRERLRKAAGWWAIGFGAPALILSMMYSEGRFEQSWMATVPLLLVGLAGTFIFMFNRHEDRLTPDAAKLKAHYEALAKDPDVAARSAMGMAFDQKVDVLVEGGKELLGSAWVRYPAAAVLLWFAVDNAQTNDRKGAWMLTIGAALVAIWLARELSKWLIGIAFVVAIVSALISGLSSLPVSGAIILGALIIAAAMK